ncbi:MAG: hypothetical protein MJ000_11700 [Bacteroidales bacterium]|nr:hypothetical protein [Bacteroidales bacterium]
MAELNVVSEIKTRLGITGNYHDDLLAAHAADVKEFLIGAGVSEEIVNGAKSVGVITRGVSDLWNYGSGDGKFSQTFFQMATQLALRS